MGREVGCRTSGSRTSVTGVHDKGDHTGVHRISRNFEMTSKLYTMNIYIICKWYPPETYLFDLFSGRIYTYYIYFFGDNIKIHIYIYYIYIYMRTDEKVCPGPVLALSST